MPAFFGRFTPSQKLEENRRDGFEPGETERSEVSTRFAIRAAHFFGRFVAVDLEGIP